MASNTQTNGAPRPQPTLLGLPAELRNEIYLLVAVESTRPLLVSRLMQLEAQRALLPPDNRDNVTLVNRLNNAVGLHPLSQTCRQLRDEFQPVFLHNSAPCHRLIINNFDVAQTEAATPVHLGSGDALLHIRKFRGRGDAERRSAIRPA